MPAGRPEVRDRRVAGGEDPGVERGGIGKRREARGISGRVAIFAIDLSCRWEALYARDRLLEALSLDAGAALLRYVELKKLGLRFDIPKNGLERFRQPY